MSDLSLYNTRTRKKEKFIPINPDSIKMYVCGPTVYNYVHIGNARPFVAFDTLYRVLQNLYPEVIYARNITDIDDKIMKAAADQGVDISNISERYTRAFNEDMAALNILDPVISPKATETIAEMLGMIQALIDKGHAYIAEGHVLFDVKSMTDYGKLSNRALEDMLEGARVEVAPYKKYAGDFVLWKPSSDEEPGWPGPWGRGRPGWHLECSAMIEKHLGETIDIHGGGRDLIFPHHENELAQSQCSHPGKTFVQYWMHNGYVNIDGEKMSKSLGNFRTVRDLLSKYHGETLRFTLLSAQYRSDMDFSAESIAQAQAGLDTLYGALRKHAEVPFDNSINIDTEPAWLALMDDLNTPLAISELHALARELNIGGTDKAGQQHLSILKSKLLKLAGVMGLLQQDPETWFTAMGDSSDEEGGPGAEQIELLIAERQQAKLDKNFARADEIREQLKSEGVILEDARAGTSWKRER